MDLVPADTLDQGVVDPEEAGTRFEDVLRLPPSDPGEELLEARPGRVDATSLLLVALPIEDDELDDPLVDVVVNTARQVYGVEPVVYPLTAGTGPMYDLCQKFGIPAVSTGVGNADSKNHAPNENVVIEDYIQGIKHIAWIMEAYAER